MVKGLRDGENLRSYQQESAQDGSGISNVGKSVAEFWGIAIVPAPEYRLNDKRQII